MARSFYNADIAPRGFQFAEIDKEITPETVKVVRQWLETPETAVPLTTRNYALGGQHFSYTTLAEILLPVISGVVNSNQ